MESDFNHIKEWLDPQLEQKCLSIERFANEAELSRAAVYFYRNDKNRPGVEAMARMCKVLGVPLEEGLKQYTPRKIGRPPRTGSGLRAVRVRGGG